MPRKPEYDRNALIETARDLFWQRGWAGTTLKDLEKALKMKPGSFYAAFGSKDALFELAMNKYATDGVARLKALAEKHGPIKALQRYPAMVIDPENNPPAKACMLAKTVLELQAHGHPLAEKANNLLLAMETEFAALFAAAQSAGDIDPSRDPKLLARRYQSDLMGLRVSAERNGVDAAAIATEIADSLERR